MMIPHTILWWPTCLSHKSLQFLFVRAGECLPFCRTRLVALWTTAAQGWLHREEQDWNKKMSVKHQAVFWSLLPQVWASFMCAADTYRWWKTRERSTSDSGKEAAKKVTKESDSFVSISFILQVKMTEWMRCWSSPWPPFHLQCRTPASHWHGACQRKPFPPVSWPLSLWWTGITALAG